VAEVSTELAGARKLAAHEQAHRNSLEQRIKALEVCVCVCRHTETAWSSASKLWRWVCVCP
jgi:hypothetical protein